MNVNEEKLSCYIDSLNNEKRPKEHCNTADSSELEELLETVRLVRSIKEPTLPKEGYVHNLIHSLKNNASDKKKPKFTSRNFLLSLGSVAAVLAICITATVMPSIGKNKIVYAMTKAYEEVKTYHGIIEIVETSAEGTSTVQAKLEAWSDKSGHYYVKKLQGSEKDIVTVNNGEKKWQIQPKEKEVEIFPAFPDLYRFTFELGKEIEEVKNALSTKVIGEETIAGRLTTIVEVTPKGGRPYKIWIDKENKMPLQKVSSMTNSIQYKISYTNIDFKDNIPAELMAYSLPKGFQEITTSPEQLVSNIDEAKGIVAFLPKLPENIPAGYTETTISVGTKSQTVKTSYTSADNKNTVIVLQGKSKETLIPVPSAMLGKVNNNIAEIQSPIENTIGVLGGGIYAGMTNLKSIRWQQEGFEFAVISDASLEELATFVKAISKSQVDLRAGTPSTNTAKVKVPFDLEEEKNSQKSIDAGHSPWRLDPVFVSQVFASLKLSPQGIVGDYPIKTEDLKLSQNNGVEAVVEVSGNQTPIRKVYLKRVVRHDDTGIWTVIGYDPK